jgi:hypothetical protein
MLFPNNYGHEANSHANLNHCNPDERLACALADAIEDFLENQPSPDGQSHKPEVRFAMRSAVYDLSVFDGEINIRALARMAIDFVRAANQRESISP